MSMEAHQLGGDRETGGSEGAVTSMRVGRTGLKRSCTSELWQAGGTKQRTAPAAVRMTSRGDELGFG